MVEPVAETILARMGSHPLAADTAAGVARWWLGPTHAGVTTSQVTQALDLLVACRAMRRLKLMDGTLLYSQTPQTQR